MFSRSGVYALQATLYLAQRPQGTSVPAALMADTLELPPEYLAKVLRRLSRAGVLDATRGARGGYRLTTPSAELTVERVVAPFEEVTPPTVCLLGGPCHADRPCSAHLRRLEWNEARRRILSATTLHDLLTEGDARTVTPASLATAINS